MRHGKRLAKRGTEVAIKFRTPALALFRGTQVFRQLHQRAGHPHSTERRNQPSLRGEEAGRGDENLDGADGFRSTKRRFHNEIPEAYERLLLDAS